MEIYTIGFTQTTAEHFFGRLKAAGVQRLLDVRLNNSSQLAGFAKAKDLPYFLSELVGATYEHEPLLGEVQLVQARPATEGQLSPEQIMPRDLDDQTREHQILLDLGLLGRWRLGCPLVQVCLCDHRSGSTVVFMRTPQVGSACPRRGPEGLSSAGSPRSSLAARRSGPRSWQEP